MLTQHIVEDELQALIAKEGPIPISRFMASGAWPQRRMKSAALATVSAEVQGEGHTSAAGMR